MLGLDEERDGVLRALGIEPEYRKAAIKKENTREWMLEFLSDEKKEHIARMTRDLENRLATRDHNSLSGQDIQQLWREHGEAVKRLLTPEEALQYDLRISPLAGRYAVRRALSISRKRSSSNCISYTRRNSGNRERSRRTPRNNCRSRSDRPLGLNVMRRMIWHVIQSISQRMSLPRRAAWDHGNSRSFTTRSRPPSRLLRASGTIRVLPRNGAMKPWKKSGAKPRERCRQASARRRGNSIKVAGTITGLMH